MVVEEEDQERARTRLVNVITWYNAQEVTIPDTDWWRTSCQPMRLSNASDQDSDTLPKATTMLPTEGKAFERDG